MRITVFGAGAWGTALAIAFSEAHETTLWVRDAKQAEVMRSSHHNARYLPDIELPASLALHDDFEQAACNSDLNLIVTPLSGLRQTIAALRQYGAKTPIIWACKGLEAGTGKFPHDIVAEEFGKNAVCGFLTGPSFAAEVAAGLPTAITLASADAAFATQWAQTLHQPRLRIYANDDLIGAEVGAALKNVIAIAAGVSDGMGLGLNARAALLTRGLAEMARLSSALGGKPETLMGLAGMGDLILTCTGDLSRNRRVGLALAKGHALPDILRELGHVAEGVPAAREAMHLANRYHVDMPICAAIHTLMQHGGSAGDIVRQLLARDPKSEQG